MPPFPGPNRNSPGKLAQGKTKLGTSTSKNLAAAALLASAGSLLSAGSAQAGLIDWSELFPATGVGACNDSVLDPRCTVGDKSISNFATNFSPSTTPTDTTKTTLAFTEVNGVWDVNLVFLPEPVEGPTAGLPFRVSYDLTINTPFDTFEKVGLDSACNLSTVGPCTVKKEISLYNAGGGLTPAPGLTRVSTNGAPALPAFFGPGIQKIRVTDSWQAPLGGSIDAISNNFTQTVPGPLPLFGAAAAFGWSRRLRSRVKPAVKAGA